MFTPLTFLWNSRCEDNALYLKLVHLCDIQGSRYGKGKHGIPFKPETYDKLSGILDLYNKYNCKCSITLEVEETDFLRKELMLCYDLLDMCGKVIFIKNNSELKHKQIELLLQAL